MESSNEKFVEIIDIAVKLEDKFDINDIDEFEDKYSIAKGYHIKKWTNELYEVLTKKLTGDALLTLRNVEGMCGFEVWRLLYREFNPTSPARALKDLVDVLTPVKVLHEKDLGKAIDAWHLKLTKLKKDHGNEYDIGDKLKVAIVTAMCPGQGQ